MKKFIYRALICSFFLFGFSACNSEFLELDPQQSIGANNAIRDLTSMQSALFGLYNNIQDSDVYGRSIGLIPEIMADNIFISSNNAGRYLNYDRFSLLPTDGFASGSWTDIYEIVVNGNRLINEGKTLVPNLIDPDAGNQIIGEALVLRGLAYFDLLRLFAQPHSFTADASHLGVPLFTDSSPGIREPSRNTVAEVYTQIVADLEEAITLMNEDQQDGRASIGAAKALLARVSLYAGEWQDAINYATDVIDNGGYSLVSSADYVSTWKDEYNSESIFEVANTEADNAGTDFIGYFFDQAGYGDGLATEELFNLYSATDVRSGFIIEGARAGGGEDPAYIIDKYKEREENFKIIRLSELYLIRAEANAELNNPTPAQNDLTTIVQRADPNAAAITETGTALMDRIILERRKELAFEGHRLFDLNRKKMDVDIINVDETINSTYPNDKYILPIPQREIDANPNIANQQNPGYN